MFLQVLENQNPFRGSKNSRTIKHNSGIWNIWPVVANILVSLRTSIIDTLRIPSVVRILNAASVLCIEQTYSF